MDLAGGYARWHETTEVLLADLDGAARDAVLGGMAARFYGFAGSGAGEDAT